MRKVIITATAGSEFSLDEITRSLQKHLKKTSLEIDSIKVYSEESSQNKVWHFIKLYQKSIREVFNNDRAYIRTLEESGIKKIGQLVGLTSSEFDQIFNGHSQEFSGCIAEDLKEHELRMDMNNPQNLYRGSGKHTAFLKWKELQEMHPLHC